MSWDCSSVEFCQERCSTHRLVTYQHGHASLTVLFIHTAAALCFHLAFPTHFDTIYPVLQTTTCVFITSQSRPQLYIIMLLFQLPRLLCLPWSTLRCFWRADHTSLSFPWPRLPREEDVLCVLCALELSSKIKQIDLLFLFLVMVSKLYLFIFS